MAVRSGVSGPGRWHQALLTAVGAALTLAACGGSGNTLGVGNPDAAPTGCLLVELPHGGHTAPFTLPAGTALCLAAAGVQGVLHVQDSDPGLLPGSGTGPYRGQRAGTATLTVSQSPRCSPGSACPHVVVLLGRVQVVITAS